MVYVGVWVKSYDSECDKLSKIFLIQLNFNIMKLMYITPEKL